MDSDERWYQEELEVAAKESHIIKEAHNLLDVLVDTYNDNDFNQRLLNLDKFLQQIALIEDFEYFNEHPVDTEELEKLSERAISFAVKEGMRAEINKTFSNEIWEFLKEFDDFIKLIKETDRRNFRAKLESIKTDKPAVRYKLPELRFFKVPTTKYIEKEQPKVRQQNMGFLSMSEEEKKEILAQIEERPDKILQIETRCFADPQFVEQLKSTAYVNFPKSYKTYNRKMYGVFTKKDELERATEDFKQTVERKIAREMQLIKDGKGGKN